MKLRLQPPQDYVLSFPRPLLTSRGPVRQRHGVHLVIEDAENVRGLGEVVTWPGFATDDSLAVENELQTLAGISFESADIDSLQAIRTVVESSCSTSEVRAGLELALLDWMAKRQNCTVAQLLAHDPSKMVRSHTLVSGPNDTPLHAHAIKVKVGNDIEDDWQRVRAIRKRVGDDMPIRLDANGAWTFSEANYAIDGFSGMNIEFIEQPIAPGSVAEFAQLRQHSLIPLAADESIKDVGEFEALLDAKAIDCAVLKPAFLGGLLATLDLAKRAEASHVGVVITHALGSIIERSGALHLAAALRLPRACGLGHPYPSESMTGYVMSAAIAHLPEAAGLGTDGLGSGRRLRAAL